MTTPTPLTSHTEKLESDALVAGEVAAGALRGVEVAAVVLIGLLVCPPLAILATVVVASPARHRHGRRAAPDRPLAAVPARPPPPRGRRRPPAAAGAPPPPCGPGAARPRCRTGSSPRARASEHGDPPPAAARHGRDAADDPGRAVLRPRLRLRGHAALAPDPRRPVRRRRRARRLPAAGRVVGVDLHDLDGQLVRPGLLRAGPRGADGGDARQPAHGRRAARGVRRPGAAVRGELRRAPGRPQRRRSVRC